MISILNHRRILFRAAVVSVALLNLMMLLSLFGEEQNAHLLDPMDRSLHDFLRADLALNHTGTLASSLTERRTANKSCVIRFIDEKQLACHSEGMPLLLPVVKTILENHFMCSAEHVGFKNVSHYPETRFDWKCLWTFEPIGGSSPLVSIRGGDHVWGPKVQHMHSTTTPTDFKMHQVDTNFSAQDTLCILGQELDAIQIDDHHSCESLNLDSVTRQSLVNRWTGSFPFHLFQTKTHSNSSLVIILGNLRGGEKAWNSLYKHVLDINNADLMIFTVGRTPASQRNSSLYHRAKFIVEIPQFDDWADAVDIITHGNQSWRTSVPKAIGNESILMGGALGSKGSGALIFMARWLLRHHLRELRIDTLYDRFIVTRSDHYYLCDHDLSDLTPVNNAVHVPNGQDWNGICDRHLVCGSDHIYTVLNIIEPLILNPQRYEHYSRQVGSHQPLQNTESFLKKRWQEDGILKLVSRFPRSMFTCAVDGDNYLWKAPSKDKIPEAVYFKYKQEYALAKSECLRTIIQKNIDPAVVPSSFKTPPKGALLKVDTSSVNGWACDLDDPFGNTVVNIHIHSDLTGEIMNLDFKANAYGSQFRKQCGGGLYHRFAHPLILSDSFIEAARSSQVTVRAYAVDLVDANVTTELKNSPTHMWLAAKHGG